MANPAERELAAALGCLELTAPSTSHAHLWYRAGLEAGRRRASAWRAVAAAVTLGLIGTAFQSVARPPATITVDRIVYVPRPSAGVASAVAWAASDEPRMPASSWADYLWLCDALAEQGKDARPFKPLGDGGSYLRPAPPPPPSGWPPSPTDDLLDPHRRLPPDRKG